MNRLCKTLDKNELIHFNLFVRCEAKIFSVWVLSSLKLGADVVKVHLIFG